MRIAIWLVLLMLMPSIALAIGHVPGSIEEKRLTAFVPSKKPPNVIACRSISVLEYALHSLETQVDSTALVEKVNARYRTESCILVTQEDCAIRAVVKESTFGSVRVIYMRVHVPNLGDYFVWMVQK